MSATEGCPCGWGLPYADCCGRLHGGDPPPTAEALMRSRYTAFALADVAYLEHSWHSSTRPGSLTLDPSLRWAGLHVLGTTRGGMLDDEGEVEFVARWQGADGSRGRQHERSRFVREDGRWVYLDAVD